ncbi:hypothetical protein BDV28DRAFT_146727 [Aspergillus coremiiformis]|uniref:Uncharacterized protein n=1 Tax=Aspergillus coremiiformis TaxID=138285 RepID=A0A5N6ZFE6_9EURO|nr:hypothetical protein BDV28DRAFT_146727 [Aspergillus coremiiformis]
MTSSEPMKPNRQRRKYCLFLNYHAPYEPRGVLILSSHLHALLYCAPLWEAIDVEELLLRDAGELGCWIAAALWTAAAVGSQCAHINLSKPSPLQTLHVFVVLGKLSITTGGSIQ